MITLSLVLLFACTSKHKDEKAVARVNDAPILLSELQKEVAHHQQQYPAAKTTASTVDDHLNEMIDRKLMIQEAVKAGLSEDERFAETIKRFWEQTLLRELITAKNKEWEKTLMVTDDEVRQAYARMGRRCLISAARATDRAAAEALKKNMQAGKRVRNEETVGPCFYDDVKLTPLENAFDMRTGETGIFPAGREFVVIRVERTDAISLPRLATIQENIRQNLLEQKREKALAAWVESLRRSAKITVNKELTAGVVHDK